MNFGNIWVFYPFKSVNRTCRNVTYTDIGSLLNIRIEHHLKLLKAKVHWRPGFTCDTMQDRPLPPEKEYTIVSEKIGTRTSRIFHK